MQAMDKTEGDMNDGVKQGLRIVVAAVLAIALLLTIAVACLGRGLAVAHDRVEARAAAFCASVALGVDVASLASSPHPLRTPVDAASGSTEYRYRFFGGPYYEADCRLVVDASGRVVAKRAGRTETFKPDRVFGASGAASR
jgi:hypothetical protein